MYKDRLYADISYVLHTHTLSCVRLLGACVMLLLALVPVYIRQMIYRYIICSTHTHIFMCQITWRMRHITTGAGACVPMTCHQKMCYILHTHTRTFMCQITRRMCHVTTGAGACVYITYHKEISYRVHTRSPSCARLLGAVSHYYWNWCLLQDIS